MNNDIAQAITDASFIADALSKNHMSSSGDQIRILVTEVQRLQKCSEVLIDTIHILSDRLESAEKTLADIKQDCESCAECDDVDLIVESVPKRIQAYEENQKQKV